MEGIFNPSEEDKYLFREINEIIRGTRSFEESFKTELATKSKNVMEKRSKYYEREKTAELYFSLRTEIILSCLVLTCLIVLLSFL